MFKKENLDFKKIINENGVPITNCYFIDTPENILATMVEDAPKDFKQPLYLQKSVQYLSQIMRKEIELKFQFGFLLMKIMIDVRNYSIIF